MSVSRFAVSGRYALTLFVKQAFFHKTSEGESTMSKLAIHGGTPVRSRMEAGMLRGAYLVGEEEAASVAQVMRSQSLNRYYGPDCQNMVQRLEGMMSEYLNVPYVLGVTSCTAALITSLKALGIGYGDKVIVPANTFTATPGAVICSNAVPVYVDIDETLNLDPNDLERVMDDEVKAIIAVHINGQSCEMDKILSFARKHGIAVVEDVAQSIGTSYKGQLCGSFGDISAYSFHMQKIVTGGEGGAVSTHSRRLFERAVRYHDQGGFREKGRYGFTDEELGEAFVGQNYRMSEVTGAVIVEQWKKLDKIIASMRRHHRRMQDTLAAELPGIRFRESADPDGDICCVLGIQHPTRERADQFVEAMAAENLFTYFMYGAKPIYMTPFFLNKRTADKNNFPFDYPFRNPVEYREGMCPRAEDILQRTTLIPVNPVMTDEQADEIIEGVIKVYRGMGWA
jgi:8-amino-3,8-dideoxy-alpha-D-manno-octulosonate transaminase